MYRQVKQCQNHVCNYIHVRMYGQVKQCQNHVCNYIHVQANKTISKSCM